MRGASNGKSRSLVGVRCLRRDDNCWEDTGWRPDENCVAGPGISGPATWEGTVRSELIRNGTVGGKWSSGIAVDVATLRRTEVATARDVLVSVGFGVEEVEHVCLKVEVLKGHGEREVGRGVRGHGGLARHTQVVVEDVLRAGVVDPEVRLDQRVIVALDSVVDAGVQRDVGHVRNRQTGEIGARIGVLRFASGLAGATNDVVAEIGGFAREIEEKVEVAHGVVIEESVDTMVR